MIEGYLGRLYAERDDGTDAALRWGSREVRISRLELLDGDGRPTTSTSLGAPVTFRFHYEADLAVDAPHFTFAVTHLDGTLVTNPNTVELGQVPPRIEGAGHLDYVVPRLMLVPGQYDLSAGVLDRHGEHVFDRRQRAFRFEVGRGVPDEISGVMSLGGHFAGPLYDEPAAGNAAAPAASGRGDRADGERPR